MTHSVTGPGRELKRLGVRPSRSMGQNFLVDGSVADLIVSAAGISPGERILEIGPGLGILTRRLASLTKNLVAVELDSRLAENLVAQGIKVIRGDALEIELPEFDKVVSNLPYQISSPITLRLLDHGFKLAILMFQKEFAEHLVASPGEPKYSRLSVMVNYRSRSRIIRHVPKGCFHPVPKVDSAVVEITPRPLEFRIEDQNMFAATVRVLFSHKNRKVRNAIVSEAAALGMDKSAAKGIGDSLPYGDARPITLSPAQISEIADVLAQKGYRLSK